MKFFIQILVKDLYTPAEYFDKTTETFPFVFHIEAQVFSSPNINKNKKDQHNSVLTSTHKNLLRGSRRNGLVSVSKTNQKRSLALPLTH